MKLNKQIWLEPDFKEYENYLLSLKGSEKECEFEKRIINTKLECLGIKSNVIKQIIKEIYKGNFESFVEGFKMNNYNQTIILGSLICKIKDFNKFKMLLTKYAENVDNWASCDCLKFDIKNDFENYFSLAFELLSSKKEFVRRIGVKILFNYIQTSYYSSVLQYLSNLSNENKYYTQMAWSWFLCEGFIKNREKTLSFFVNNNCNSFIVNKAISKCNDSFRILDKDKILLKKYRKK